MAISSPDSTETSHGTPLPTKPKPRWFGKRLTDHSSHMEGTVNAENRQKIEAVNKDKARRGRNRFLLKVAVLGAPFLAWAGFNQIRHHNESADPNVKADVKSDTPQNPSKLAQTDSITITPDNTELDKLLKGKKVKVVGQVSEGGIVVKTSPDQNGMATVDKLPSNAVPVITKAEQVERDEVAKGIAHEPPGVVSTDGVVNSKDYSQLKPK